MSLLKPSRKLILGEGEARVPNHRAGEGVSQVDAQILLADPEDGYLGRRAAEGVGHGSRPRLIVFEDLPSLFFHAEGFGVLEVNILPIPARLESRGAGGGYLGEFVVDLRSFEGEDQVQLQRRDGLQVGIHADALDPLDPPGHVPQNARLVAQPDRLDASIVSIANKSTATTRPHRNLRRPERMLDSPRLAGSLAPAFSTAPAPGREQQQSGGPDQELPPRRVVYLGERKGIPEGLFRSLDHRGHPVLLSAALAASFLPQTLSSRLTRYCLTSPRGSVPELPSVITLPAASTVAS